MSLQENSALIPNCIVDDHKGNATHSQTHLSRLVKTAVEKALRLQAESGRLVDVVDTRSCGESRELGCSYLLSPFNAKLLKNAASPTVSSPPSQTWELSKESEDRLNMSNKIITLLVKWRPDVNFKWREKVVHAAPVFEEALYRGAKSKEDYRSHQLLESRLKQVLLHFEAGNGIFLLQGTSPLYCTRNHYIDRSGSTGQCAIQRENPAAIVSRDTYKGHDTCVTYTDGSLGSDLATKASSADCVVWDGPKLRIGLQKHQDNTKKNITRRFFKLLSVQRMDDNLRLRNELGRAGHNEEKFARLFAKAEKKIAGVRGEAEPSNPPKIEQGSSCRMDVGTRRTPHKALGNMLNLDTSSVSAGGGSPSVNMDAVREQNTQISLFSADADVLHARSGSTEIEEIRPLSSSPLACCGQELREGTSEKIKQQQLVQEGLSEIMECLSVGSSPSSSSSSSALMLSTMALSPSQEQEVVSTLSPTSLIAPFVPSSSTMSAMSANTRTLSLPAASCHQGLCPQPLSSSEGESQQILASSSRQPSETVLIAEIQANIQEAEPERVLPSPSHSSPHTLHIQQAEPERVLSSSAQLSPYRTHRGIRLPLSIFLAERQECGLNQTGGKLDKEAGLWDIWEEPTQQMDSLCCVCMVGLKGAAFIPCGHTFCRKCSRELWKGRGACPLCNKYITNILDVY